MAIAAESLPASEAQEEYVYASYEEADKRLHKTMGLTQLTALGLGAIIGSGWLFAVLGADATAGPSAVLSWLIGGILVLLIALNYAEIAGMLPRTGALSRYPALTHGGAAGMLLGWAYLLSAISVPAIEAEASVTYLSSKFPTLGLIPPKSTVLSWPKGIMLGVGFMALFFVINFVGIRLLSEANRLIVLWKLVIPTLTFIFVFTAFNSSNFSAGGGFFPLGKAPMFEAIATSGIVFSYLGFRQALEYAGEARRPQKDVPRATILSVLIAIVLYCCLQLAFTGAINWGSAGIKVGDWSGLGGSTWATGPFYRELHAAGSGVLAGFAALLIWDAVISPAGTGYVYMGTSTRTVYGLSVQRLFPPGLQKMNKFGIPWPALIASVVVGVLFFTHSPSWYNLVGFISSATVLTYIMGGGGLVVLRRVAGELPRPYRMPAMWVLAPLGFVAAAEIVFWSGFGVLVSVFAAVFLSIFLLLWYYGPSKGWFSQQAGLTLGVAFLATYVFVAVRGGWVLRSSTTAAVSGSWTFGTYFVAFTAVVILSLTAAWLMSNEEGRNEINRCWWFVFLCLSTFLLSYYSEYGAQTTIHFPWADLMAAGIGVISFFWCIYSGYETDDLKEVKAAFRRLTPVPSPDDGRKSATA